MTDKISRDQRSQIMAKIRGKDTGPERRVRSILFRHGLRFRIHRRDLPGVPDIVLPKHRTVVFVHGCFWHGHNCARGRRPQSNVDFWNRKLDRNIARDHAVSEALSAQGWWVETVWTCRLVEGAEEVVRRIQKREREGLTNSAK